MKLFCIFPDIHDKPPNKKSLGAKSYHPALRCAEEVAKALKPHGIIYLGDVTEMSSLSHFDSNKQRKMEGRRYRRDIDSTRTLLDRHSKFAKEFIYCIGNHEQRVETYLDYHPECEETMDYVRDTGLVERGMEVIPYNRVKKLGKALFTHGHITTKYHAASMAQLYQRSIFYGHTHDCQSHSVVSPVDFKEVRMAESLGCLCGLNPAWLRGRPNRWVNAVSLFYLKDNGEFNLSRHIIIRGETVINGHRFRG